MSACSDPSHTDLPGNPPLKKVLHAHFCRGRPSTLATLTGAGLAEGKSNAVFDSFSLAMRPLFPSGPCIRITCEEFGAGKDGQSYRFARGRHDHPCAEASIHMAPPRQLSFCKVRELPEYLICCAYLCMQSRARACRACHASSRPVPAPRASSPL